MEQYAVGIFWFLVVLAFIQALMATRYYGALLWWKRSPLPEESCPKAAAILCVRGPDPFLADTVAALLEQDYPDYGVFIVIDSRQDPAWKVVEEVVHRGNSSNVHLMPLTNRRGTCSLKIASVLQAIEALDESYRAIVMLDSDTVPYRTWLRELVQALEPESIGAASGNRWYMPNQCTWGSLVRYAWNVAAVVPMYLYRIAWGGSMAIDRAAFEASGLSNRLAGAFGEDSTICRALIAKKRGIAFVPSAMMVNRETCDIRGFYRFLIRQLLTVRLHNPWWWAVVAHGVLCAVAQTLGAIVLIAGLATGDAATTRWAIGGLALYLAVMVILLATMEVLVRRIVRARGESTRWLSPVTALGIVVAIPLTQVVYTVGLLSTMFTRTHRWRGIVYRFGDGQPVRVVEDHPYSTDARLEKSTTSL